MSKVMVSLPDDLVRDINEEAKWRSMSRSAHLTTAAWREFARRDPATISEAITRSEQRFRAAEGFDVTPRRHVRTHQMVSQQRRVWARRGSLNS